MIFYIEGPDHSGKTVLSNYLIKSRKANYIHSTYNKDWNLENYHDEIGMMAIKLNSYKQDVVLDRWCLSHYAYRFVNKENSYNPRNLWNEFVTTINPKELIVIYCIPAGEFDDSKREEMFNKKEVSQVENEYNNLFSEIPHYTYYYKTDGKDMEKFIQDCINIQSSSLLLDYHWKEKIEFLNYGNEEQKYLEQEEHIDDYAKYRKEQEEEQLKDALAYDEYLKQLYENERKREEEYIKETEKKIKEKEDLGDLKNIITVEYNGDNYILETHKDEQTGIEKTVITRLRLNSSAEIDNIKENSDIYNKIMKKVKSKETKVDEKSIDYSKIPWTIACDFDDTLVKNAFPKIIAKDENINWDLVNKLKDEVKSGKKLVLFTNRTGQALDDAVTFCNDVLGLVFDAINDNIKEVKDLGLDPRKIWYNVLYDDKSITIKF